MVDREESAQWLAGARRGDDDAWTRIIEALEPYLRILAQRQLESTVRRRVDPTDAVQETCLEAHRDLPHFRGTSTAELAAWLRRILEHNVAQAIERHVVAQRRSVRRERSLDTGSTSGGLTGVLPGPTSSPSQRAMRGEGAVRLARALAELPEDQREAVRLRHIEGWTLAQMAAWFERSELAVAGLLKRGLQRLRGHLHEPESGPGRDAEPLA
jgi:RNA polymerase sigma-70 factor (ECF subfamily)